MHQYPTLGLLGIAIIVVAFAALAWFDKLPSIDAFTRFVEVWNTRGGNIVILAACTLISAWASVRMFIWVIDLSAHKLITLDNVFAVSSLNWLTGFLTAGFLGALLKTMDGSTTAKRDTTLTTSFETPTNATPVPSPAKE